MVSTCPVTGNHKRTAPLAIRRRSDADVGDGRRPTESYGDGVYLGREEENEDVQKNRKLTLDALVLAVVKEEVGGGGNGARRAAAGVEEDELVRDNDGELDRFLLRRCRGRRGGDGGVL